MSDSPHQSSLPLAAHNNQSLFSDHYLNDILRRNEMWRRALPQAEAFLAGLRELYGREQAQLPPLQRKSA
jgi:hypothetical protein